MWRPLLANRSTSKLVAKESAAGESFLYKFEESFVNIIRKMKRIFDHAAACGRERIKSQTGGIETTRESRNLLLKIKPTIPFFVIKHE